MLEFRATNLTELSPGRRLELPGRRSSLAQSSLGGSAGTQSGDARGATIVLHANSDLCATARQKCRTSDVSQR